MFGLIPRTIWSKWVEADALNRIELQTNCILLRRGEEVALIEAGYGAKWTAKERSIYELEHRTVIDALREQGVEPESVSTIILSHLHFDHAAGLTIQRDMNDPTTISSTFPRARIVVQRREWDDAIAGRSTMTRTYFKSHLDPIARQMDLVAGTREVLDGVVVEPLPGHTWGMQSIRFSDERGMVVFGGDIIPTPPHIHRSASLGYDMLPHENMLQKERFLNRAAEEKWRIVLSHDPSGAVYEVQHDERGWFQLSPSAALS